ncbi:MAG: NADH-quinone oxidoreductase subunit A [Desulfurococcales archaeon]|nr:NADH-quinone oxidoreductase subunit A [Desulfurococcales archaeon]
MPVDPSSYLVKALVAFVVLPLVAVGALVLVLWLLRRLTLPRPDVMDSEKFKYLRYESGNPMKGEARRSVSMQYFGFLIIFLAVEPAIILLALLLMASEAYYRSLATIYGIFLGVYAPLLVYAVRESRKVGEWVLE